MRIIDCHFHWWPRVYMEKLSERIAYPLAKPSDRGGYHYRRREDAEWEHFGWPAWFDLDRQFKELDALGHEMSVISSIGPLSVHFSDFSAEEGARAARFWNEQMAWAQREYAGRFWGTAAVPLVDTGIAIDIMEQAVGELGLVGVNVPGMVAGDPRIDAPRLEPFYARAAELGVPIFMHPTDGYFPEKMQGYDGALYASLGRVVDVSTSTYRLVLSGIMERYPDLKVYVSHTGGALPYQSGRMDKNSTKAGLPQKPSTYLKRMVTDTTSPHALGVRTAIEYYGVDQVMYGSDYPCWDPAEAIQIVEELKLSPGDARKIFHDNAVRFFSLPAQMEARKSA